MKKFIPKLTDYSLLDVSTGEFFIDADLVLRSHKLFAKAANKFLNYTIDPRTNRLPFTTTKSMEELPYYFPKTDLNKILNDSSLRLHSLITPCIDFQIENGSKRLLPPYFYTEDVTSQTFNINIENITNVIKYIEQLEAEFDIFPVINFSANLLSDPNLLRYITSMYLSDEFEQHIKGFYLMIDGFDANWASEQELIGLLQIIKSLSKKELYVISINAFGYAALLLGANGFISGLTSSERVSVENWKLDSEERKKIRPRASRFTYMPEIFSYIDEYELKQMGYTCDCSICRNSLPQKLSDKKKHFYACRTRDINAIFTGDFHENLSNLKKLYLDGKKKAVQMISNRQTTRTQGVLISPINKWLSVLDRAEEIEEQEKAEDVLKNILKDIDDYNDKGSN